MFHDMFANFPLGFGPLLMQHPDAQQAFEALGAEERKAVARECATLHSREEMEKIIAGLERRSKP